MWLCKRKKDMIFFWVFFLILYAGLEVWYVFPMLLYRHFHFSCRMSPALGWIPALEATFGKPSWSKFRMAVQLCNIPQVRPLFQQPAYSWSLPLPAVSWEQKSIFWRYAHPGVKHGTCLGTLWQFFPACENWTCVNPKYFLYLIFKE